MKTPDDTYELIKLAVSRRENLLQAFECFRLFDGSEDGISDLVIEKIGPIGLVYDFGGSLRLEEVFKDPQYLALFNVEAICLRKRPKHSGNQEGSELAILQGCASLEYLVNEGPLKFKIDLSRAINGGLFLDTRELRARLFNESKGKKVLNTFAYTGSLGIACYGGGAKEVVQVDSSKSILAWAKNNFELNKLDNASVMKFIVEDVGTFLEREIKRIDSGKKVPYEIVILDPPTFGRSEKGVFNLENSIEQLISLGFGVCAPGGLLYICLNNRNFSHSRIKEAVRRSIPGDRYKELGLLFPPEEDFRSSVEASSVMRGIIISKKS